MTDRGYPWRAGLVVVAVAAAWTGLSARLVSLHLGPNEHLRAKVERMRKVEQTILVGRGRILDSHGNILALDIPVKDVWVDPEVILEAGHVRAIGMHLARLLQLDPAVVLARISRPGRRYERIKRFVPEDVVQEIRRLQLNGVHFDDVSARYYPQGALFCHVLGYANQEGVGGAGTELALDAYLRGRPGLRVSQKDALHNEILVRRSLEIAPQEGADVYLTLDQNVQYLVEKALDAAIVQHRAKGAWAVVERVKTGEIVAMASRPAYDANEYGSADLTAQLNRAIGYVFEPGSIFKAAVVSAALNEGVVSEQDVFDCENGAWLYHHRILRDYHRYGNLTVSNIVKESSNIGAAKVALRLGERRLEEYLRAFGLGRRSGIDLPGEEAGILHGRSRWSALSITRIPMGHEVGVTALQMVNLLSAIANDGVLMRPAVVQRVVHARGGTIREFVPKEIGRPIRPETAQRMRRLLTGVTDGGGTGTRGRVDGYAVGGKTGTAQKPVPGGYSDRANIASFMGFLPAEDPALAIIVVVDEPQPLHTGGLVAAPVFSEIASQAVRYLDIPPALVASAADGRE